MRILVPTSMVTGITSEESILRSVLGHIVRENEGVLVTSLEEIIDWHKANGTRCAQALERGDTDIHIYAAATFVHSFAEKNVSHVIIFGAPDKNSDFEEIINTFSKVTWVHIHAEFKSFLQSEKCEGIEAMAKFEKYVMDTFRLIHIFRRISRARNRPATMLELAEKEVQNGHGVEKRVKAILESAHLSDEAIRVCLNRLNNVDLYSVTRSLARESMKEVGSKIKLNPSTVFDRNLKDRSCTPLFSGLEQ